MGSTPPEHSGHEAGSAGEAVQRADALLTDVGQRLGQWSARLQRESVRLAARTREEFEDIWAEAQAMRHQEHATGAHPTPPARIAEVPPGETSRPAEEQRT